MSGEHKGLEFLGADYAGGMLGRLLPLIVDQFVEEVDAFLFALLVFLGGVVGVAFGG